MFYIVFIFASKTFFNLKMFWFPKLIWLKNQKNGSKLLGFQKIKTYGFQKIKTVEAQKRQHRKFRGEKEGQKTQARKGSLKMAGGKRQAEKGRSEKAGPKRQDKKLV